MIYRNIITLNIKQLNIKLVNFNKNNTLYHKTT